MSREYVIALKESLEKKVKTLEEIKRLCKLQTEALDTYPMDYKQFDRFADDKDILIKRLEKLDEGFETVFERVSEEIHIHKSDYAQLITQMQELIKKIADLGVSIQSEEEKNRAKVTEVINRDRKKLSENKRSVNVAMNYYKNMTGIANIESQFLDQKK